MLARRWGCTPQQVRECTVADLRGMVRQLEYEDRELEELEAERREQELAAHFQDEE